jgi:hypothetical protein
VKTFYSTLILILYDQTKFYDIKELRTPTKKTNPTHNEAPENTTFLLLDQPSGEASTTGTPITKRNEIAIKANTAN